MLPDADLGVCFFNSFFGSAQCHLLDSYEKAIFSLRFSSPLAHRGAKVTVSSTWAEKADAMFIRKVMMGFFFRLTGDTQPLGILCTVFISETNSIIAIPTV